MIKTIEQLWNGNLEPIAHSRVNNPEIKHLTKLIQRNHENLKENLNEKLKEMLENYSECKNEYLALTNEQAFCNGFCLGMRIAAEALIGAEEIT